MILLNEEIHILLILLPNHDIFFFSIKVAIREFARFIRPSFPGR